MSYMAGMCSKVRGSLTDESRSSSQFRQQIPCWSPTVSQNY